MTTETVNAWFLHKRPSGDTSCRVTFYTREFGVVEALYKGGRSPKKQALLQPFTSLWLMLDVKHEWYYVRKLELETISLPLQGNFLFSSLYINELIFRMLKPHDPDSTLYLAYLDALKQLSQASDTRSIEPVLRRFERILLRSVGYDLELTREAQTGEPIKASCHYDFIPNVGFMMAPKGLSGAHIKAFSEDRLESNEVRRTAKWIMRKAVNHVLDGKPIQSRAYITSNKPLP